MWHRAPTRQARLRTSSQSIEIPKTLPSVRSAALHVGMRDYEWHEEGQRAGTTFTAEPHLMPHKSTATGEVLEKKTPPPGRMPVLNLGEFNW